MRKTLAVFLLLVLACSQQLLSQVFLQPRVPANAPTTTQVRAPNGLSTYTTLRAYALYPTNELTELASGSMIKQLGFVATNGANAPAGGQIKFYIQNTSDQTLQKGTNWPNIITGMTQVYDGTLTLPVTNGGAEIIVTLDVPFTYTGGALYVAWDYLGSAFCSTPLTYAAEGSAVVPGCASANNGTTTPPTTLGTTAFRPQLILGMDNPFAYDLAVSQLKATGLFSPGLGGANKVTAMIRNRGSQPQTGKTLSWTIAGISYSSSIPSLAPGDSIAVEYTVPATTAAGTIQIEAAVGADERNTNNSMQITQQIVCDELRYGGQVTPDNGVGFGTGAGIIAAHHKSPGTSIIINAITTRLSDQAANIGNNLKGVVLDENGVILATSADFPITSINNNTEISIPLTTPVTIAANTSFYAGFIQPSNTTGYYPFGSDYSRITEPNRYYTFNAAGGTPAPIVTHLGEILIGFAGQPVAGLTSSITSVLKQGQKSTFTATTGYDNYEFRVNNVVKQSSSSNIFVYAPGNNEVISVNVTSGACVYPATNTVTMQVTEITPTAGIVYVKKGATGNGSSWANAAGELADVLLAARVNTAITQVWVAGGTYLPLYSAHDGDLGQSNGRRNSFVVTGNLKLYGGFAGTETALSQRNLTITANRTILSGDLDGNDNPNGAIAGDNAYNVVIVAGNHTPVFDGLTIRGGKAETGAGTRTIDGITVDANVGGGMNFNAASPELNNMIIQGNTAVGGGGIMHNLGHVTISNSLIAGNMANGGGGIYINNGYLSLVNSTMSGNTATNGGAIFNSVSTMEISNSIIYGNSSGIGGALANVTYSVLQDNITGTGNSTGDPQFVDMPSHTTAPFTDGNYALQTSSPAVNTGSNAAILALPAAFQATDLAGNTRIVNLANGGIVDRGAYELQRQLQIITVSDLNKVYGDADFEPGATTTSGLTISYVSSDNNIAEAFQDATDGNKWKIKVKRAGDVTITASQAGTPEYFPAADEPFELSIATKPVTVQLTAATLSKVYDATTDGTLAVTNLAIASVDIVSGDDLNLTISSSAFTYDNKNVGDNKQINFPLNVISLSGTSAGNYKIANTTDLTATTGKITPAQLTVTAAAKTKVYGESDPALTYSYAGFATGDAAVFTGALSRNPGEDAGDYAIIQNTLSAGTNYSILYTGANLTISKATQTITWVQDLVTGCNGVSPITLTATSSSGLDVSYLAASSAVATVTGQTLTPVGEGATTITAIQAGDANHEPATAVVKTFSYQLSSSLRQHFADALFFDNSGGKYVQWQWYKNGNLVSGFNTPYYNEATALNGTYYAMVTDKNGNMVQTCPVTLTGSGTVASGLKVAPNPAKAGSTVSITCSYTEPALQGATLQISNISGTVLQRITTVRPVNAVVMPAAGGLYVITLTLSNGQKSTVNVLVN